MQRGAGCLLRPHVNPLLIGLGLTWFPEGHRVLGSGDGGGGVWGGSDERT